MFIFILIRLLLSLSIQTEPLFCFSYREKVQLSFAVVDNGHSVFSFREKVQAGLILVLAAKILVYFVLVAIVWRRKYKEASVEKGSMS